MSRATVGSCILSAMIAIAGCADSGSELAQSEEPPAATTEPRDYSAPHSMGRWCARPQGLSSFWHVIEIVTEPALSAHVAFADGSHADFDLRSRAEGEYEKIDSPSSDRYEIARDSLRAIDNDGLIFVARRMEANSPDSDCFGG